MQNKRHQLFSSKFLYAILAVGTMSSCSQVHDNSKTKDIFTEDQGDASRGNDRRHPASSDEKLWTINMSGCTGHLISPDYMMSAAHCSPSAGARYKSGYALTRGESSDITVSKVVEIDRSLDYSIMKITWSNGYPKNQKFPPLIATKASDVNTSTSTNQGDELFTVGFPQDKMNSWGATYAEGRAKTSQSSRLFYNIGIINGNSGGGVWRKSDRMLVSLTNGGSHIFGQSGWDTSASTSSANWNFGPAIWDVYAKSATLKDIFPGGRNRFASDDSTIDETTTDVKILIAETAVPSDSDNYVLYFSTPQGVSSLVFCTDLDSSSRCKSDSAKITTTLVANKGDRNFFKAAKSAGISQRLEIAVDAFNPAGRRVGGASALFEMK